jgi:predicted nucleotidyltransferase
MKRQFHFDEDRITLPKGTRVVLKTDLRAVDGDYLCKAGTVAVVVDLAYDSYTVRTPSGRRVECQRDQLVIQRRERLPAIAERQHNWEALKQHVIYSSVVGSTAWGLADDTSDEDIKGVFLLPFAGHAGLWQPVDEIQDPGSDTQLWEVQKLVYQGLRADANTLELLWSPHVRVCTELGQALVRDRRMFVSRNIFGTFGRYAMSQFRKMRAAQRRRQVQRVIVERVASQPGVTEAGLVRHLVESCPEVTTPGKRDAERRAGEAIRDLYNSLYDRGLLQQRGYEPLREFLRGSGGGPGLEAPRWKNAYNLLRLLHSGIKWLDEGEPLIAVTGELRSELLAVKRGEVPLDEILARADDLAARLERAFEGTRLPEEPDYERASAFLLRCREVAAAHHLSGEAAVPAVERAAAEPEPAIAAPRRFEIPEDALRAFLARYAELDFVVCSLVGSHSYGFPSRDSDFDLKGIHLAPADQLLGLEEPGPTEQFLGVVEGLEIDFTSHEARGALGRVLRGDGNVLERILSPYLVAPPAADERLQELRALCVANLSRRFHRHYSGFFRGQVHQYEKEPTKKIKTLLYIFRVALTGVHLLREGQLVGDLRTLLEVYQYEQVRQLFALKEQAELAVVDDDRPYLELVPRLEQELAAALERSPLPEEPQHRAALDAWLKRQRRRASTAVSP